MRFDGEHGCFPLLLHQDFVQRPPSRKFRIVGDAGCAEMDLIANRLYVYGQVGELCEQNDFADFNRNDMFLAQAFEQQRVWLVRALDETTRADVQERVVAAYEATFGNPGASFFPRG